jgi:hypothetical protein
MNTETEPTEAEREGYDAWRNGKTLDNCPSHYSGGSKAEGWQRGWLAADRVFREALKGVRERKSDP